MLYRNMISFKGSKIHLKKDENNIAKEYYITFRWVLSEFWNIWNSYEFIYN